MDYGRSHLHRRDAGVLCRQRPLRDGLRKTLKRMETIIAAIIALLLFVYLLYAMLRPEKF